MVWCQSDTVVTLYAFIVLPLMRHIWMDRGTHDLSSYIDSCVLACVSLCEWKYVVSRCVCVCVCVCN